MAGRQNNDADEIFKKKNFSKFKKLKYLLK